MRNSLPHVIYYHNREVGRVRQSRTAGHCMARATLQDRRAQKLRRLSLLLGHGLLFHRASSVKTSLKINSNNEKTHRKVCAVCTLRAFRVFHLLLPCHPTSLICPFAASTIAMDLAASLLGSIYHDMFLWNCSSLHRPLSTAGL